MKTTGSAVKLLCLCLVCSAAMAANSQAATVWTGLIDSDFSKDGNWTNGSPGNTDTDATIGNGGTIQLSSNFTGTNPYKLVVSGSSTLNASHDFSAIDLRIDTGSTVNLTGGSFTLPNTSPNNNGQNGNNPTINGTLDISGGTHVFNERIDGSGTFRVDGSDASITTHQIGGFFGSFEFIFDSNGVSTIAGDTGFAWFSIAGNSVSVDGSALVGGGSFTLFDSHSAGTMMANSNNFTVTGLGTEGVGWNLAITDNPNGTGRDSVVLNVTAVPEPSSAVILGIGLVAVAFRRRRQQTG